jgi:excisionase family DNA binding protein
VPNRCGTSAGFKPSWVYDAVRTGNLPCLRVGRHIRFTRAMIESWLTGQTG